MLQRRRFDISSTVNSILDKLPSSIWTSSTTTFLDPAIGGGQFVAEIERRLTKAGHSIENIKNRVFGYEANNLRIRTIVGRLKLKGTYRKSDFINEDNTMKFDVVVGNPPFNNGDKDSTGGTGGNSRLYKHFRVKALDVLNDNGYLIFISLKNIIKDLIKDGNQIDLINLMTDNDHWAYNTLFFVERKTIKTSEMVIEGGIAAKMFGIGEWKYNEFNRTENRIDTGDIEAVLNLPKVANDFKLETAKVKTALPAAPRFAFTLLESSKSYTVTDLPYCGSMTGCVTLDTLDEARALRLLIENNKAVRYFYKAMKLKGLAKDVVRYMKKIDLGQIKTGFEYPTEWNLTNEEISLIEK